MSSWKVWGMRMKLWGPCSRAWRTSGMRRGVDLRIGSGRPSKLVPGISVVSSGTVSILGPSRLLPRIWESSLKPRMRKLPLLLTKGMGYKLNFKDIRMKLGRWPPSLWSLKRKWGLSWKLTNTLKAKFMDLRIVVLEQVPESHLLNSRSIN